MATITDKGLNVNIDGTSLKGYLMISYFDLLKLFGDHHIIGDSRSRKLWYLEFNHSIIISIYDWKSSQIPLVQMIKWNLASKDKFHLNLLVEYFNENKFSNYRIQITDNILELFNNDE